MKYVLDSNIVIRLLENDTIIKNSLEGIAFDGDEICISAITYYEIKRGLLAIDTSQKATTFDRVSKSWVIMLLDKLEIFELATKIYSDLKTQGIKEEKHDADILIAASTLCQDNDTVLVTYDKIFGRIHGLKTVAW